jgi:phosphoglycolate phosphatase-like HAD superfamily hydrolase
LVIRCAIFDFDGTLAQSVQIKRDAFYAAATGIPGATAALKEILADPAAGDRHRVFATLAARLGSAAGPHTAVQLTERYTALCFAQISACPEVPGALECLQALQRAGVRLFLHSRTPIDALLPLVRARALAGHFEAIWGAPTHRKEAVRQALAAVRCAPREAVLVSDDGPDALVAAEAGVRFVGVALGDSTSAPPEFASATVLATLTGLPALLRAAEAAAQS